MPMVNYSLYGIEDTIDRPIVIKIADDFKSYLGFQHDIRTIINDTANNDNDPINKKLTPQGELTSNTVVDQEKLEVEYTIDPDETYSRFLGYRNPRTKPFYVDNEIGIYGKAYNEKRKLTLTLVYSSASKSSVNATINRIKQKGNRESFYLTHDLEYSYVLPHIVIDLIYSVYKQKQEDISFGEYISKYFDTRVTLGLSPDGNEDKNNISIRERQVSVQGYITTEITELKKEYDKNTSLWSINLTYVVEYETPTNVICKYPIVVNNKLLPEKHIKFPNTVENRIAPRTPEVANIYHVINNQPKLAQSFNGKIITYPPGDEVPDIKIPGYVPLFSTIITVDENDPYNIMNLNDMVDIKLKNSLVNYLKYNGDRVGEEYCTLFGFFLINNESRNFTNKVKLDEDGNLRSSNPLDPKVVNRLMLFSLQDLDVMKPDCLKKTKEFIKKEIDLLAKESKIIVKVKEHTVLLHNTIYNSGINNEDKLWLVSELDKLRNKLILLEDDDVQNQYKLIMNKIKNLDTIPIEIKNLQELVKVLITDTETMRKKNQEFISSNRMLKKYITQEDVETLVNSKLNINNINYDDVVSTINSLKRKIPNDIIEQINNVQNDINSIKENIDSIVLSSREINVIDVDSISLTIRDYLLHKLSILMERKIKDYINSTFVENYELKYKLEKNLDTIVNTDIVNNNEDTIQDIVLGLYNIPDETVVSTIKGLNDTKEVIFNIKFPEYDLFYGSSSCINLTASFKEKFE